MNLKARWIVALFLFAPSLVTSASALTIGRFINMNNDDEAAFVALLVDGTSQMLKAAGHPDQASKVIALFHDTSNNGGVHLLANNLKTINAVNNRNGVNPNNRAPVLQVEDAMSLTFKDAGIIVSTKDLLIISKDFAPSGPSRSSTLGH